ncbi:MULTISPECIES: Rgg/GadR/MutR family transcriptional regulator [unclassified Streptococcus]|uniref:Rgg/GadR/MutR family transcriptional regulator n=1 Tax=unclassified Streptococcus TaxID=2608887 RepID=UPI001072B3B1|nr:MULTISPECIES: Rgg/GadR/MutR family transcriptional regulator [unclassified Streptococcus]MBF0805760.1 Rgg/GadR/MutR family transcriptional regulator [Streptococcus sp. 19428wA2_WM07]TFU28669.1 Rgg/GadR/MutR family transcriptional regulator [Streptococcus sp. WM07]
MKSFGKVFKQFRQSRGLSLRSISNEELSVSQLSRFENEQSDLTISKFKIALDEINMPMSEFMYAVQDFKRDELQELLYKMDIYVLRNDVVSMRHLLASRPVKPRLRRLFHELNTIIIKIKLEEMTGESVVSEHDLNVLTDYLIGVEYWGYYELLLFMHSMHRFRHTLFMTLSKEMISRSEFYKELPINRRMMNYLVLEAFVLSSERQELIDAQYYRKFIQNNHFEERDIFERMVIQYAEGMFEFFFHDERKGLMEMEKVIQTFRELGSIHLAQSYENRVKAAQKIKESKN